MSTKVSNNMTVMGYSNITEKRNMERRRADMVDKFIRAWEANKRKLAVRISKATDHYRFDYEDLVQLIFEVVINPYLKEHAENNREDGFDVKHIHTIDDGTYDGTKIFFLHKNTYQPNAGDYIYTSVYYGSCSACDTLQGIQDYQYDAGEPNEAQVKDYMRLCLYLVQHIHEMME